MNDFGSDDYSDITAEEARSGGPDLYHANRCKAALAKAAGRSMCARWSKARFLAAAGEAYAAEEKAIGGELFPSGPMGGEHGRS